MPFQFTCERCGQPFTRHYKARVHRFCSRACRYAPKPCEFVGDGTVRIPLNHGKFAVIDEIDAPLVCHHNWSVQSGGTAGRRRLPDDPPGTPIVVLYRLILGARDGEQVDHADRDRLNNRRANIRLCNGTQNGANRRLNRTSTGFRGVDRPSYISGWRARIKAHGKSRHLGIYPTPEEAARAYDAAATEAFGEFASLNFPDDH